MVIVLLLLRLGANIQGTMTMYVASLLGGDLVHGHCVFLSHNHSQGGVSDM